MKKKQKVSKQVLALRRAKAYRKAYLDPEFLSSDAMRPVRLQLELQKPEMTLAEYGVKSTVVVFGSARIWDKEQSEARVKELKALVRRDPKDPVLRNKLASAERLPAFPRGEQRLVHVVVEDRAGALQVHPVERDRDRLDERIADRVGVAEALALHQLDPAPGDGRLGERLDHEAHHAPRGAATSSQTPAIAVPQSGQRPPARTFSRTLKPRRRTSQRPHVGHAVLSHGSPGTLPVYT